MDMLSIYRRQTTKTKYKLKMTMKNLRLYTPLIRAINSINPISTTKSSQNVKSKMIVALYSERFAAELVLSLFLRLFLLLYKKHFTQLCLKTFARGFTKPAAEKAPPQEKLKTILFFGRRRWQKREERERRKKGRDARDQGGAGRENKVVLTFCMSPDFTYFC